MNQSTQYRIDVIKSILDELAVVILLNKKTNNLKFSKDLKKLFKHYPTNPVGWEENLAQDYIAVASSTCILLSCKEHNANSILLLIQESVEEALSVLIDTSKAI